jgi:hypothetical protein
MTKTKADTLYESLANFTTEEGAIECGAKMRDYARELERFLDGERIARQYAIDKECELERELAVANKDRSAYEKAIAELERENARLREALKWAEPYVPKHSETYRMISELPNVQAQR